VSSPFRLVIVAPYAKDTKANRPDSRSLVYQIEEARSLAPYPNTTRDKVRVIVME
jgi:hypothetical protein